MEKTYNFVEGTKVVLPANEEEGWPRQTGTVLQAEEEWSNGTLIISLDPEYLEDANDDGLREVCIDDIEVLK